MNRSARSMQVFGIYMLLEGLTLMVAPQVLLVLLGLSQTTEVWIRVSGVALMVLSYYYLMTAHLNLEAFFALTVPTRIFQFVAFGAFVAFGLVKWTVLIPAAVEMASGLWTWMALRTQPVSPVQIR